jgi:hypothetical protein
MLSSPPYPHQHRGTVLVCGSAWTLHDDLDRARAVYPDAPVIAVNDAARSVQALAIFSMHPLGLEGWAIEQRQRFGDGCTVHSVVGTAHRTTNLGLRPPMPWVDYWWEGVAHGGTSVWAARRLTKAMGFSLAVLCGAALSAGPYAHNGWQAAAWRDDGKIRHYRRLIERDIDFHPGARSMSGWTRELLGGVDSR